MTSIYSMSLLGDWANSIFQSIMLWIDSVVYWFAAQCYQLFMKLSMAQIFDNNFYSDFANRIYSILGVFMLFYLAYALLNALVDPDKLTKGDKSVSKLASNLVISLVILGLLPATFEYAYRLQNYVLSSNVIGSLIFGTPTIDPTDDSENSMIRYGDAISFTVLNTFLNSDNYNVRLSDKSKTWFDIKYEILHDGVYSSLPGLADSIVHGANLVGENAGQSVTVDYKVVISTIAGIYLCYIMLSFTLDLGVRVAKLAFCQLVAPIPVIMRAMPGKKGTFDKWLKLTLSVFFEIFVRVAIMYISIYLINGLVDSDIWDSFFSGGIQGKLALVVIIMGILTFAKQAPKMISDVLGIDSGSLKLGIGEKLKAGGFFKGASMAGVGLGMLGAGATGLVRNGIKGLQNTWADAKRGDIWGTAKSFGVGALSGIAGATSGMFNAYTNPKNMKSIKDVAKQAGIGAQKSTENREKRASYVANHRLDIPIVGGIVGSMWGHAKDVGYGIGEWAGMDSLESLKKLQSGALEVKDARKAVDDRAMAILNRDKNKLKSLQQYTVNGVGTFDNYADLLNEINRMKSTGYTSNGTKASAHMITEMEKIEYDMKEAMKKDIIAGYDLTTGRKDYSKYDNELKELVTAYRTKALKNSTIISENSKDAASTQNFLEQAVANQDQKLEDFVMSDNVRKLFEKDSNDAIKSATNEINTKVAARIEKEQEKKK